MQSKPAGAPGSNRGMKTFRIVLLLTITLFLGCAKRQQMTVTAQPPPPVPEKSSPAKMPPSPSPSEAYLPRLQHSGSALEKLVADPKNAIPDSVLNHTACFVIFPWTSTATTVERGFASCRNQSAWTSPVVVNVTQVSGAPEGTDLLLLLLSTRAVNALQRGNLTVGRELPVTAGPMERANLTTVPDFELENKDIFGYEYQGYEYRGFEHQKNSLFGATLKTANIASDAKATQALYGHDFQPSWLLARSTYASSVTNFFVTDVSSFFNAITPAGIIIHHSVLIPAKDLPNPERALDRFHYKRGFAISCFGRTYHIAYHYMILPNGEIRPGRPERCEGAHARGYNSYLGIALVGDFSSQDNPQGRKGPKMPTTKQMASLVKLCRRLREQYNIPLQRIMPHSEVSRTRCPGDRFAFKTVLAKLENESASGE